MKAIFLGLLTIAAVILGIGCGVSKAEHEKTVAELEKTVAELEKTVAGHKKSVAELKKTQRPNNLNVVKQQIVERNVHTNEFFLQNTLTARDEYIENLKEHISKAGHPVPSAPAPPMHGPGSAIAVPCRWCKKYFPVINVQVHARKCPARIDTK